MLLNRNLGKQFISHVELANLVSREFGTPMSQVLPEMQRRWESGESDHMTEEIHGGPRKYVEHLKGSISERGMRKPIKVKDGAVVDGNHRAVAAIELGLEKIPVKVVR